jgi:uncharacterized protein (UPF0332 family)
MKPEVIRLLEKAADCLESAGFNLENGFLDAAVNRSYYAVFDAVTALLLLKDITVKSHSGAIQQFSLHFIKTGLFEKGLQESLIFCFQKRQTGDYDLYSDIIKEDADLCFSQAKEFVSVAENWIYSQNK